MLDHEKLDVYRLSLDFAAISFEVLDALPRGHAALADQLRRAAMSTPLNIAEGCGRRGAADRGRYFTIARGSAMECAAIVDLVRLTAGEADKQALDRGKALLHRIVAMLTKLAR